ncbi:MAG: ABC transporter ATP-binding protein [Thermofilaceae archaeon]
MRNDVLLRVDSLTVHYRSRNGVIRALERVSFSLKSGEIVSLVGETGSGKSTVALAVMRLLPSDTCTVKGAVFYNGLNLLKLSEMEMCSIRGKEIAMIFQEPKAALNPLLTIGFQLREAIEAHTRASGDEAYKAVIEMLNKVGLPDADNLLDRYPHELSGGMAQRVMIAMALLLKPKLLIADEPTSALDVSVQAQILELINRMVKQFNTTALFITHDLGVAAEVSDRLVVMYAGKIAEIGDVYEVFEEPLHPYSEGLLSAIPKAGESLRGIDGEPPNLENPPPGCRFHPRCPYAKEKCRTEEPEPIEVKPGRVVVCHLYSSEKVSLHAERACQS